MSYKSYKTDKVGNGYLPTYEALAEELGPDANVCEIGVDNGYGLEMFQDLFPGTGVLVGVDYKTCPVPEGVEFIKQFQEHEDLVANLLSKSKQFDLIVDDASHDGQKTWVTFNNVFPMLRVGGYYVIEDWGVGFPGWNGFDDSMLTKVAHPLLNAFDPTKPDLRIGPISYSMGLIVVRRRA